MKKTSWERLQAVERMLFRWTHAWRTGWLPFRGITESGRVRRKGLDDKALSLVLYVTLTVLMVSDLRQSSLGFRPAQPWCGSSLSCWQCYSAYTSWILTPILSTQIAWPTRATSLWGKQAAFSGYTMLWFLVYINKSQALWICEKEQLPESFCKTDVRNGTFYAV